MAREGRRRVLKPPAGRGGPGEGAGSGGVRPGVVGATDDMAGQAGRRTAPHLAEHDGGPGVEDCENAVGLVVLPGAESCGAAGCGSRGRCGNHRHGRGRRGSRPYRQRHVVGHRSRRLRLSSDRRFPARLGHMPTGGENDSRRNSGLALVSGLAPSTDGEGPASARRSGRECRLRGENRCNWLGGNDLGGGGRGANGWFRAHGRFRAHCRFRIGPRLLSRRVCRAAGIRHSQIRPLSQGSVISGALRRDPGIGHGHQGRVGDIDIVNGNVRRAQVHRSDRSPSSVLGRRAGLLVIRCDGVATVALVARRPGAPVLFPSSSSPVVTVSWSPVVTVSWWPVVTVSWSPVVTVSWSPVVTGSCGRPAGSGPSSAGGASWGLSVSQKPRRPPRRAVTGLSPGIYEAGSCSVVDVLGRGLLGPSPGSLVAAGVSGRGSWDGVVACTSGSSPSSAGTPPGDVSTEYGSERESCPPTRRRPRSQVLR